MQAGTDDNTLAAILRDFDQLRERLARCRPGRLEVLHARWEEAQPMPGCSDACIERRAEAADDLVRQASQVPATSLREVTTKIEMLRDLIDDEPAARLAASVAGDVVALGQRGQA